MDDQRYAAEFTGDSDVLFEERDFEERVERKKIVEQAAQKMYETLFEVKTTGELHEIIDDCVDDISDETLKSHVILDFCKKLFQIIIEKGQADPVTIASIDHELKRLFEGLPGSLANYLDPADFFEVALTASREPVLQHTVAASLLDQLVWKLPHIVNTVKQEILKKDPAGQLDSLQLLQTVGILSTPSRSTMEICLPAVQKVTEYVKEQARQPFVRICSEVVLQRIDKEKKDPNQGFIRYSDDKRSGRDGEISSTQDTELRDNTIFSEPLQKFEYPIRLSADYVGIVDQSGLLHKLGRLDVTPKKESLPIPITILDGLKSLSRKSDGYFKIGLQRFARHFAFEIINNLEKFDKDFVEESRALFQVFPLEKWQEYSEIEEKISEIELDHLRAVDRVKKAAEADNASASNAFVELVIARTRNVGGVINRLREMVIKAQSENDHDLAFSEAERIVGWMSHEKNATFFIEELAQAAKELEQQHILNFRKVEDYDRSGRQAYVSNNHDIFERRNVLLSELNANVGAVKNEVTAVLNALYNEVANRAPHVTVKNIEQLTQEPTVMPFGGGGVTQDQIIFLQQMHNPQVRAYVERDLGIQLSEVPLRGQVQLLGYLLEQDGQTFEKIKATMLRPDLDKISLVKSFFTGVADKDLLQALLHFAETAEVPMINALLKRMHELLTKSQI